jgi:hypothetical protein
MEVGEQEKKRRYTGKWNNLKLGWEGLAIIQSGHSSPKPVLIDNPLWQEFIVFSNFHDRIKNILLFRRHNSMTN